MQIIKFLGFVVSNLITIVFLILIFSALRTPVGQEVSKVVIESVKPSIKHPIKSLKSLFLKETFQQKSKNLVLEKFDNVKAGASQAIDKTLFYIGFFGAASILLLVFLYLLKNQPLFSIKFFKK